MSGLLFENNKHTIDINVDESLELKHLCIRLARVTVFRFLPKIFKERKITMSL